ncbi:hypothetical protein HYX14_04185 [Candidatus Woesearchaeota archaeon]|nr:hypothetical protein [Candidatus Woesearchaeota archaeon]
MNTLRHCRDIIEKIYQSPPTQFILLLYDLNCTLSKLLTEAYSDASKMHPHSLINFDDVSEDKIQNALQQLPPHSLVILVQSASFRLTNYRLRMDLSRAGHRVIEHARLAHNDESQIQNYINSLQYDTSYYVRACHALEKLLLEHKSIKIESNHHILQINSDFEKPIKNTGDFSESKTGSTGFPIGEIFTEAKDLSAINGAVTVFGFPTTEHKAFFCEPFTVTIKDGCVISHTGPQEFEQILNLIKGDESGKVQIREIGFGLNRALGFEHRLNEPTSFERFCGMHFSLGLKHTMYRHKMNKKIIQKYHIDIFCLVDMILIGETMVFKNGKYVV